MSGTSPANRGVDALPNSLDVEASRKMLRQRWELASVLNFVHVFEPVIGDDLKMEISAEDTEFALIEPNSTLAELHIALLKGILSSDKTLKGSDAWIIALSKTLKSWWHWVGEGDFPLNGSKGELVSTYKQLQPTSRLLILKALCEVRAEQYDAVSHINDSIKNGTPVCNFRKEKVADDGNGISYWYDGSDTIGYRLYREVNLFGNGRLKVKAAVPTISFQWDTIAANLEEFKKIEREFSSSEIMVEVAVSKYLSADVIPALEERLKKKLRAQQRQQRVQMLLNGYRNSGITRSCRSNKPVDYKFDDYDRSIKEAIQYANKRKTIEEQILEENQSKPKRRMGTTSNISCDSDFTSSNGKSAVNDADRKHCQRRYEADGFSHEEYDAEKENQDFHCENAEVTSQKKHNMHATMPKGSRFSKRLAGIRGHAIPDSLNLGAKNRSRQRPNLNTAFDSLVVPDSEDDETPSGR